MAKFQSAFEFSMDNEDRERSGVVIKDAGGVTKYGISFNFLKHTSVDVADFDHDGKLTENDVRVMTFAEARKLYEPNFWKPVHGDEIVDQYVANKVYDLAVNAGVSQATALVQRALFCCGVNIVEDRQFGPKTLAALNSVDVKTFIDSFRRALVAFRNHIAAVRPVTQKEMTSWTRRDLA